MTVDSRRRRRPAAMAVLGWGTAGLTVLAVAGGPWLGGRLVGDIDPRAQSGPSPAHPLGTDSLGRDLLGRVLELARPSVLTAVAAVALAVVVGVPLGCLAGVGGPRTRRVAAAVLDALLSVPGLLVALVAVLLLDPGRTTTALAIAAALMPGLARLTMTLTAAVGGRDFVAASRLTGAPLAVTVRDHVLPNVARPVVARTSLAVTEALVATSALSFIGLGVQPPESDWGRLLADALPQVYVRPWTAIGPAVAIIFAGAGFSVLGDVLGGGWRERAVVEPTPRPRGDGVSAARDDALAARDEAAPSVRLVGLRIEVPTAEGWAEAVSGVDLVVHRGERVALVGESGAGKTLTALAAAGVVDGVRVTTDVHEVVGVEVAEVAGRARRRLLGDRVGVVFQDPAAALNPTRRVGSQVTEALAAHRRVGRAERRRRATVRFKALGLDPARTYRARPSQLSGGMRQRAAIVGAVLTEPDLVVADEPTASLDAPRRRAALDDLDRLVAEAGASLLLVSHDIPLAASWCDRVIVLYAGEVVEELPAAEVATARHPYTRALLACVPEIGDRTPPVPIPGAMPPPGERPAGCLYAARCERADAACTVSPALVGHGVGAVRCWHPVAPVAVTVTDPVPVADRGVG